MPEFQLDLGETSRESRYSKADPFTQGYVEAMFFTADEDLHATVADLAPEAWADIEHACATFQAQCKATLAAACEGDYSEEQAGRDFWFTRNGHGVGFWDRKELEARPFESMPTLGEALSKAAERAGECDLYRGDDGRLYL